MNKQELILNWLQNNPGPHFSDEIAVAVGLSEFATRTTLRGLLATNKIIALELQREVAETIVTELAYEYVK